VRNVFTIHADWILFRNAEEMTMAARRSKEFISCYLVVPPPSGAIGTTFTNTDNALLYSLTKPVRFVGFKRGIERACGISWRDVAQEFRRPRDVVHSNPPGII
jgi:hypothetical protein